MGADSIREVIIWLKVILFVCLAETLKIGMENHFAKSEETIFLSSQPLSSFHRISRESLISKKLFGRALAGFSRELALEALRNAPKIIIS